MARQLLLCLSPRAFVGHLPFFVYFFEKKGKLSRQSYKNTRKEILILKYCLNLNKRRPRINATFELIWEGMESGRHWWEASALTTAPSLPVKKNYQGSSSQHPKFILTKSNSLQFKVILFTAVQ